MKRLFLLVTLIFFLFISNGFSQNDTQEVQLKSKTIVTILAFDPIPGDALFYSGHSKQGFINAWIGLIGGFAFYSSFFTFCDDANTQSDCEDIDAGIKRSIGILMYFPMLIWDGVGGIRYVSKHNKEILRKQQHTLFDTIRPYFTFTSEGGWGGISMRF